MISRHFFWKKLCHYSFFRLYQAKRSGITKIILPAENEKDYTELQAFIKEGITVYFVRNYEDVFNIVFSKGSDSKENTN